MQRYEGFRASPEGYVYGSGGRECCRSQKRKEFPVALSASYVLSGRHNDDGDRECCRPQKRKEFPVALSEWMACTGGVVAETGSAAGRESGRSSLLRYEGEVVEAGSAAGCEKQKEFPAASRRFGALEQP